MRRSRHSRLLAAAVSMLLTGSLAGASGLVLCVGSDGHRAIEREHASTGCPTLGGPQAEPDASFRATADCLDVPTLGAAPAASSSPDAEWSPRPPVTPLAFLLEPADRIQTRFPASTDARAGPSRLAPHLTSIVLLV